MPANEIRAARDIINVLGYKSIFTYIPEMEISVPSTDQRNSLDKIAYYFRSDEITLSDLYIGYAISLYRYTIPKVVADTIQVLGKMWPQKNVPKTISRDALLHRIKKMCSMGMLRRFVYELNSNNIVLYSTTPEFANVIHNALKLRTDARQIKDIIPPIEIVEKAAASIVTVELLKSPNLKEFTFMPEFQDSSGKVNFYARLHHKMDIDYVTIIEPTFTKIDLKRFTDQEWEEHLRKKIVALKNYINHCQEKYKGKVQLIIVLNDTDDFRLISKFICTYLPDNLKQIFFTSEGALKSANYKILQSLVHITTVRQNGDSDLIVPGSVSSQLPYSFF